MIGAASLWVFSISACAANSSHAPLPSPVQEGEAILDRLYFGRSIPSGGTVSEADWHTFLAEIVTPRFPEGLTLWHTEGQWRDPKGVIWKEDGFVLELTHPVGAAAEKWVHEIMREYIRRFKQEAVLRIQTRVRMEFESGGT